MYPYGRIDGKLTFFSLPAELRIMIYDLVLNDGLDLPFSTKDIVKSGHTGPIPYDHLEKKAANMAVLSKICRQIKWEAVDPLFETTQLYINHQTPFGDWVIDGSTPDNERTIELITNRPIFLEFKHLHWVAYFGTDKGVWFPADHKGVNRLRQRFSPEYNLRSSSYPVWYPWLMEKMIENLETLHLDFNWRIDWLQLCQYSRWLYLFFQKVKKLTLSLNFEGKDIFYERAKNSRYVKRGKPVEMMEANILNHILTLPEDYWKDAPKTKIKDHFGVIEPDWPLLPEV